ncbi:DNA cytosine methyltransferase [Kaistella rhinocerotis]|uniref:DNA cytosine methyltransferase n=1 Tax=Kaistella rhinocerotis TaxID=3026437 RepID=UPI002555176A|nr:DNA cytosine methyltransferase [Kaistella sp. Ran72]
MEKFKFIDLFCGIGGFHQAMERLGGECVFASDIDKNCREVYSDNYGLMPADDITKVDENEIPEHDMICGGFPCQSFSKAGNRKGINDPRGTLFYDILRIAKKHKPKYMLLENVRNLASHDNGLTWRTIYENIRSIGYNVHETPIIFSPHFLGHPQHRERVFIMCKREDLGEIDHFYFDKKVIKDASADEVLQNEEEIAELEKYLLKEEEIQLISHWDEFIRNIKTPLPGFPVWADRLRELDMTEDLEEKPKWERTFILKNNELYIKNREFLDGWLKKSDNIKLFKGSKAKFEWQAGKVDNPTLWNTLMHFRPSGLRVKQPSHFPALVAITQTSIVGERRRFITPRECARLQGFPDTFKIPANDRVAYKQFGNAVNVDVVELFGRFLLGDADVVRHYTKPSNLALF